MAGPATDLVSYFDNTVGVTVNLATGTASGGNAEGDTLISIETVRGSVYADTLIGGDGSDNSQRQSRQRPSSAAAPGLTTSTAGATSIPLSMPTAPRA